MRLQSWTDMTERLSTYACMFIEKIRVEKTLLAVIFGGRLYGKIFAFYLKLFLQ